MLSSPLSEGLRGIQSSQREIQKSANEIARASTREPEPSQNIQADEPTVIAPVSESKESTQRGIEEPLIELRRQEQLFTASAQVISVADQTIGSLIDVKS